jgi:Abnormal spindle-like microcephaly-assoc'd, ASPM-SPD-2-Hydin
VPWTGNGYGAQTTVTSGLTSPLSIAVDGAGDLFIAEGNSGSGEVLEVPAGCTTASCQTTVGSGFVLPEGVAVDGAGDVFITDYGQNSLFEVPSGGAQATLASGLSSLGGVAVDRTGDIFIAAGGDSNGQVMELQRSQPPSLSFANTAVGSTSSNSPQSVTLQNIGNQALSAIAPGLSITGTNSSSFAQGTATGDCTSTFSLTPGGTCNLSISFTPTASGSNTAALELTDNALNASPSASQSLNLSGTGLAGVASGLPTGLSFGSQIVDTTSAAQTVTLSNTGTAPLAISTVTISGNFAITSDSCLGSSLANGSSCAISVVFTPQSTGTLAGMLTITDNSNGVSGSTQLVSLSGTGLAAFTITPTPSTETINRGVLGGFILTLKSLDGFSGKVTLSCSGGPAGSYCADLPQTVNLNGTAYAISGILFPKTAGAGTYTITFTGTSGAIVENATATFIVK